MSERRITCAEADEMRRGLRPLSSCTNYVGGEVLDLELPHHSAITWGLEDETAVLREVLDGDGCRHWAIYREAEGQ